MSKYYEIYKQNLLTDEDNKTSKIVLDKIMLNIDKELQQKDQRIEKLEKELHKYFIDNESLTEQLRIVSETNLFKEREKQKAVKEFAEELKKKIENDTYILTNLNIDETYCGNKVTKQELFEFIIFDLLKERGIE